MLTENKPPNLLESFTQCPQNTSPRRKKKNIKKEKKDRKINKALLKVSLLFKDSLPKMDNKTKTEIEDSPNRI